MGLGIGRLSISPTIIIFTVTVWRDGVVKSEAFHVESSVVMDEFSYILDRSLPQLLTGLSFRVRVRTRK